MLRRGILVLLVLLCLKGVSFSEIIDNEQDLIIPTGESYTLSGTHIYNNSVQIDGTLYVTAYDGSGTTGSLELTAPTITINGTIVADGKGYPAKSGPGAGSYYGIYGGSGGGYGGLGGETSSVGGGVYGSIITPLDLGSGGGNSYDAQGGAGGGAIKIRASGTLTVNGTIGANGSNGHGDQYQGGGGSGGSIYIVVETFTGSGCIVVNGGNGGGHDRGGGGGAGGRIAVYYANNSYTGTITAYGGVGVKNGGAGTIFMKSTSQNYGDLLIDNNNNEGVTSIVDGTYTFDSVAVKNKAKLEISSGDSITSTEFDIQNGEVTNEGKVSITNFNVESGGISYHNGGSLVTDNLQIGNGSTFYLNTGLSANNLAILSGGMLTHSPEDSDFNLTVANNLTIEPGGNIDVSGKGYPAKSGPGAGSYYGIYGGSGGGYGGLGGETSSVGGGVYGSIITPLDLGSGGGNSYDAQGGAGGGAIKIRASGTLTVNGTIGANGSNGHGDQYQGGGGSGGSIYIVVETFTGSGCIVVNGGNGGGHDRGGGGGAGGRIAVYYANNSYTGTITAYGGVGVKNGGAGTIFMKSTSQNYGDLIIDNNNFDGVTGLVDGEYHFDSIIIKGKSKLELSSEDNVGVGIIKVSNGCLENSGVINVDEVVLGDGGEMYHEGGEFIPNYIEIKEGGVFYLDDRVEVSNIDIRTGGKLTHSAGDRDFDLVVRDSLVIEEGGSIDVSGKGYGGGEGPGAGGYGLDGGGAGYGGKGGDSCRGGVGGEVYGSIIEPCDLGSSGGSDGQREGGMGGGIVTLDILGTLTIDGSITANGMNGALGSYSWDRNTGGGSGGSIYITVGTITGSGVITAHGGNGPSYSCYSGGGGGGGRIAIYYEEKDIFLGIITVMGGSGYQYGQEGTIYLKRNEDEGEVVSVDLPDGGNVTKLQKQGAIIWQKEMPVNGKGEIIISTQAVFLNTTGKLSLNAGLENELGQSLCKDTTNFYIFETPVFVTFKTNKDVYKPGEEIGISGEVANNSSSSMDNLAFSIYKDDIEILSKQMSLGAGEKYPFTTVVSSTHSFTLKGVVFQDGFTISSTEEEIEVVLPDISLTISGPEVAGDDYFELGALMKNESKTPANENLRIECDSGVDVPDDWTEESGKKFKDFEAIYLQPGESKFLYESIRIFRDEVVKFILMGDVEKTVEQEIKFGGDISISFSLCEVYAEGDVELPYIISNSGTEDVEASFIITPSTDKIFTQDYYVPGEGGVFDEIILEETNEGDYVFEYKIVPLTGSQGIPYVQGSFIIRVAKTNVVEIKDCKEHRAEGIAQIEVDLKNRGANEFEGNVRLDVGFYQEEKGLGLKINEEATIVFDVLSGSISSGMYDLVLSVLWNGETITSYTDSLVLMPQFKITSIPGNLVFNIGSQGNIPLTVRNIGPVGGDVSIGLSCGDIINDERSLWLSSGEEKTLDFIFDIEADLWSKDYMADCKVKNLENGLIEDFYIPISIRGFDIGVEAYLDKSFYVEGDTATLNLNVINKSTEFQPEVYAKVIFNEYTSTTDVFLLEQTRNLTFSFPVSFSAESASKVFYGIYTASGRALYLNSSYVYEQGKEIYVSSDKQIYNTGEDVNLTLTPLTTGFLQLSCLDYNQSINISTTSAFNLCFVLPDEVVSGTYYINYNFNGSSSTYAFDIAGYSVRVLEAYLDRQEYYPGDDMKLVLKIDSNKELDDVMVRGMVYSNEDVFDCFSSSVSLTSGEIILDFEGKMQREEKGIALLSYGIYGQFPSSELLLVSGREAFDVVLPDSLPPQTRLFVHGPLYEDTGISYVSVLSSFTVEATDMGETSSGVRDVHYRVDSDSWTVVSDTSIVRISGLKEGMHTIRYYSSDNAGNIEGEKSDLFHVDGTAPNVELQIQGEQFSTTNKTYTTSKSTITIFASDPEIELVSSGIKELRVKIDGGEWQEDLAFSLEEGTHTVEARAYDNVGNENESLFFITIDDTPPETYLEISDNKYEIGDKIYVCSNTGFYLNAVDPLVMGGDASGVDKTFYRIKISTSTPFIKYDSSFTITGIEDGECEIEYYSSDNLNNIEMVKSTIVILKNTPPVVELISPSPESRGIDKVFIDTITIIGTVYDQLLDEFEVRVTTCIEGGGNYIYINRGKIPVSEGILGQWDSSLYEGNYLRLEVAARDLIGTENTASCEIYIGYPLLVNSFGMEPKAKFNPVYIAVDGEGYSYVTNHDIRRPIVKFDRDGNVVFEYLQETIDCVDLQRYIVKPEGIALDKDSNIYVVDTLKNRVLRFDPEGNITMQIGGLECRYFKEGKWFGHLRCHFEKTFNNPSGVVLDEDGFIYVADRLNNRIQKFTPEGEMIEEATINTGICDGEHPHWERDWFWWSIKQFFNPGGIALDSEGYIYVSDKMHSKVIKFNLEGELVLEIGAEDFLGGHEKCQKRHGKKSPKFSPDGIAVSGAGYVYVADSENNLIYKFDRYGNYVLCLERGDELDEPKGVALDNDGNIYVVDSGNSRICVFEVPEKITTPVMASRRLNPGSLSGIDTEFRLGDIYPFPNPAKRGKSPTLHIEVGVADEVDIRIFNIAGELVHSDKIRSDPTDIVSGRYVYKHKWDTDHIASGVYIYLIRAKRDGCGDLKKTGKIAIIK